MGGEPDELEESDLSAETGGCITRCYCGNQVSGECNAGRNPNGGIEDWLPRELLCFIRLSIRHVSLRVDTRLSRIVTLRAVRCDLSHDSRMR